MHTTPSNTTKSEAAFEVSDLNKIHIGDARRLVTRLQDESVAVTITSPPYFDLKDYGTANQIGFGQSYDDYLNDLGNVFNEIHRATKKDGSLWIVIDTFRRDQEVWPLPFDLAARLKQSGWSLRDIIIWKKDRTLPWTHDGTTKKIFEYILVFARSGNLFKYDADSFRESTELKKWWVQYPERYNPKGKALEEVWNFDIPTQGSWGPVPLSHFCPLPSGLVNRIIGLTTAQGDLVLDPFAGTGTVPAQALFSGRSYLGFELNKDFTKTFQAYIHQSQNRAEHTIISSIEQQKRFEENIRHLRILKFARVLYQGATNQDIDYGVEKVLAWPLEREPREKHKILVAQYVFLLNRPNYVAKLAERIATLISQKPLSKFGIEAEIGYVLTSPGLEGFGRDQLVFAYTKTNTHAYAKQLSFQDALNSKYPLLSTICTLLEVPSD